MNKTASYNVTVEPYNDDKARKVLYDPADEAAFDVQHGNQKNNTQLPHRPNSPLIIVEEDTDDNNDGTNTYDGDSLPNNLTIDTEKGSVSFQTTQINDERKITETSGFQENDVSNKKWPQRKLPSTPDIRSASESDLRASVSSLEGELKAENETIEQSMRTCSTPQSKRKKSKSKFYVDIERNFTGNRTISPGTPKSSSVTNLSSSEEEKPGVHSLLRPSTSESSRLYKNSVTFKKSATIARCSGTQSRQTHIGVFTFIPRHKDELHFNEGDPLCVNKFHDDMWYEGINLLSGKHGLFPSRYAADILARQDNSPEVKGGGDQFSLGFLGSVEVADFKGDEILCAAIAKIISQHKMLSGLSPQQCVLQIGTKGIRISGMHNKKAKSPKFGRAKKGKNNALVHEVTEKDTHFFSMKNVTFCGCHPRDYRYFAFITKHPTEIRHACHVFMSQYSTERVTDAVGACFKKFYDDYLEYRAPTEDIYLE